MGELSRRDRLLAALVPLVLTVVALYQVTTALTEDLTPWKGGGFGMFATADHPETRVLRTYFDSEVGRVPVHRGAVVTMTDREHLDTIWTLRAHPSREHASRWATALSAQSWRLQENAARLTDDQNRTWVREEGEIDLRTDNTPVRVWSVVIEVWRTRYDRTSSQIEPELLVVHEVAVGSP